MVSIIVPIYNAEKYLKRCIKSLVNQTYANIEIILVNDGSSDDSQKICELAAKKDSRIKIKNIKNQGVSVARNKGLEIAKGKYISFVDADDYVEKDYIEQLLVTLKNQKVDIAYCSAIVEDEDGNTIQIEYATSKLINTKDYDWISNEAHCVVRGAIYPRNIIRGLKFDKNLYVGEDTYFFAQCLKRTKCVYCIASNLYHYVQYKNSESHGMFNEKKLTEIYAWEKVCRLFEEDTSKVACAVRCKNLISLNYSNSLFNKKYYNQVLKIYRKYTWVLINYFIKKKNIKRAIKYLLFGIAPHSYMKFKYMI